EGVRDLVVGLEVVDEAPGPEVQRVGTAGLVLPAVPLTLIEISPFDTRHQLLRPTAVVAQVGLVTARRRDNGAVVEIVVDRGVEVMAAPAPGPQHDRILRLVLGNQQKPAGRGGGPGGGADVGAGGGGG